MGEVDQVDDAVDHGVAQGDQGVHTAQDQAIDDLLKEGFQAALLVRLSRMIVGRQVACLAMG
jgi:hypothetical protein